MKLASVLGVILMFSARLLAQDKAAAPSDVPVQTPALDTANRVALQAIEKLKQDLNNQFQQLQQQELAILREWSVAHPGWHIDQQSLAVGQIAISKDEVPKPPTPPAPAPKAESKK